MKAKILCAAYFIVVLGTEVLYREPLYNYSLNFLSNLAKDQNQGTLKMMKTLTYLGQKHFTLPCYTVLLIFAPLNYSLSVLCSIFGAEFLSNFLKAIYANNRPFWDLSIAPIDCSVGFGNPSGHSTMSSSVFLSITHIIVTNYLGKSKQNVNDSSVENLGNQMTISKKFVVVLLYLTALAIIIVVSFTRLYLVVHTFNQVLLGCLIGTGIYLTIFFAFEVQNLKSKEIEKYMNNFKFQAFINTIVILLLIASIIIYSVQINSKLQLQAKLTNLCPGEDATKYLYNDFFFQSLSVSGFSGIALGLWTLIILLKQSGLELDNKVIVRSIDLTDLSNGKSERSDEGGIAVQLAKQVDITKFYKVDLARKKGIMILILAGLILFGYLPYIVQYFVKSEINQIKIIFSVGYPNFVITYLIHSFFIYCSFKYKLSREIATSELVSPTKYHIPSSLEPVVID